MKTINLQDANISLIDEHIVLFEANPNVIIDKQAAQSFYEAIEQHVTGNYSIIIHRKHKYILLRMEVFSVINSRERLLGLAIVVPKDSAKKMADMEASLCQKPFSIFSNVSDAVAWIKDLHNN